MTFSRTSKSSPATHFNKSHSAAYAVITYQTAYLKYYYETEFMAALLSTEMRQQENVVKYIQSAREMGIPVLSPDVNQSDRDFSVVNVKVDDATTDDRVFSLVLVRSKVSGIQPLSSSLRNATVMDSNHFKLCEATDTRKVNKKVLEALVKSGACDAFGRHRSLWVHRESTRIRASCSKGQSDRAVSVRSGETALGKGPRNRTNALGFYISGHPLGAYKCRTTPEATTISNVGLYRLSELR